MKLNKPLLRRWVKWLRSGRYRQGRDRLASFDGKKFCCLGVLAAIQGCEWREYEDENGNWDKILVPYKNATAKKPMSANIVAGRAKFDKEGGYIHPKYAGGLDMDQIDHLARMNDDGNSFRTIANYIEDEILK